MRAADGDSRPTESERAETARTTGGDARLAEKFCVLCKVPRLYYPLTARAPWAMSQTRLLKGTHASGLSSRVYLAVTTVDGRRTQTCGAATWMELEIVRACGLRHGCHIYIDIYKDPV